MSERRPHWDDALIEAVADVLEHDDLIYATTYAVIAAVEDWQVQHARNRVMLVTGNPGTYVGDLEAAIQRVRELHRRTSQGWCWECVEHAYPCATVLTLDGAE